MRARPKPALAITMSQRPHVSRASASSSSPVVDEPTSPWCATASPPAARMPATTVVGGIVDRDIARLPFGAHAGVVHDDARAVRGEPLAVRSADAAPAAGDDRDEAVERRACGHAGASLSYPYGAGHRGHAQLVRRVPLRPPVALGLDVLGDGLPRVRVVFCPPVRHGDAETVAVAGRLDPEEAGLLGRESFHLECGRVVAVTVGVGALCSEDDRRIGARKCVTTDLLPVPTSTLLPLMEATVEPLENNRVKLHIAVPETEFESAIDAAYRKIAREVRLPGFRPGKAPRKVLEARVGAEAGRQQALRDALPDYYVDAVTEHDVDVIAAPEFTITSGEEEGDLEFDAIVEVRPQVTIMGYDELRVALPYKPVDDTMVDAEVNRVRDQFASLDDSDRPLALGDFATIDLTTTIDGEEVDGLSVQDFSYPVGSEMVVPELDENPAGREDRRDPGVRRGARTSATASRPARPRTSACS